jgi:hypothetical protein
MTTIRIDRLIPSQGATPSEHYDPGSLAAFTAWNLGDEARFSVVAPDTYIPGTDLSLRLQDSTPSLSYQHAWRVLAVLLRPGLHATDRASVSETTVREFDASTVANLLTSRSFVVTGSATAGTIGGVAIQPGDCISFVLTRVPASTGEDPAATKVFGMCLDLAGKDTTPADNSPRTWAVKDTVRDLFNEAGGEFLSDEFILRAMNRCLEDLAQDDYWRTETLVPCVSGQYRIDLLAEISSFQALHQVRYRGSSGPMTPLSGYSEFDQMRARGGKTGKPSYYVVQNATLLVWPPADGDPESGFWVYHAFMPGYLDFSGAGSSPPIPRAHDQIFVYYVLKQAYLRDRHAPGADAKFQEYSALYERQKQALLSQAEPPCLELRPHP